MKKWGGRKPSSASASASSSSKPSFISQVSPFSWISKFKQMKINSEVKHGKMKQSAKQNSPSPPQDACGNRGRFYGMDDHDDDTFWRLSFSEESHEHKKMEDVMKPELHNLGGGYVIQSSTCSNGRFNDKRHGIREGTLRLKQKKDIGLGEERKLTNETKPSLKMDECNGGKEFQYLRKRYERKAQRVLQEQLLKLEKAKDEESKNSSLGRIREAALNSEKKSGSDWQNMRQAEELKVKVDKKRQSVHVSREMQRRKPRHSPRLRVNSPRMASKVEVCKIKAIEDMKRARLKMKKEEEIMEETAVLDSFAVVKCSLDPQQDFRDSMIEMITEKKLSKPEEMEELLASYLTLNSNEYHDLIIKVFREVWLCVSQASLGLQSEKQCRCHN